jgi:hypothetical protein
MPVPDGCHWMQPEPASEPVVGAAEKTTYPAGGRAAVGSESVAVHTVRSPTETVEDAQLTPTLVWSAAVSVVVALLAVKLVLSGV